MSKQLICVIVFSKIYFHGCLFFSFLACFLFWLLLFPYANFSWFLPDLYQRVSPVSCCLPQTNVLDLYVIIYSLLSCHICSLVLVFPPPVSSHFWVLFASLIPGFGILPHPFGTVCSVLSCLYLVPNPCLLTFGSHCHHKICQVLFINQTGLSCSVNKWQKHLCLSWVDYNGPLSPVVTHLGLTIWVGRLCL